MEGSANSVNKSYHSPYSEYLDECRNKKKKGHRGCLPRLRSFRFASILSSLVSLFPILKWLPRYDIKGNLPSDLIAGVMVGVMQIPQGMGSAVLANVQPVVGIYMGFFPVLVYTLLGTSRHVAVGTFSVICLMVGSTVTRIQATYTVEQDPSSNGAMETYPKYTAEQIATIVSLVAGMIQVLLGSLQMGFLCVLLSHELVSGFTTGAAIHLFTSQLKSLIGISGLNTRNGIFQIPLTYYDICNNISNTNITTLIISGVSILTLVVYNEALKPYVARKLPVPIPIEILVVIVGTLVARYWITAEEYGIQVVSHIQTGFPAPSLPPVVLIPDVLLDSFIIAIVAYTLVVSLAKTMAVKHNYEISPNQELLANGASNIMGSFFSCVTISCSLSRSAIQDQVGGKTQVASLFSCGVLALVLLWIAPFFETLPFCVLSAVIVVAVKGMFLQVLDVPKIFRESVLNGLLWIATFLGTVILDIQYGLGIGAVCAILLILWTSNKPHIQLCCIHEDCFHDSDAEEIILVPEDSPKGRRIPSVRIVKYTGSLNFATCEVFCKKVQYLVPLSAGAANPSVPNSTLEKSPGSMKGPSGNDGDLTSTASYHIQDDVSWIILDLSSVSSLDPAGGKGLLSLTKLYGKKGGINLIFCGCAPPLVEVMDRAGLLQSVGVENFHASVGSAIRYLRRNHGISLGFNKVLRNNNEDDYQIS